MAKGNKSADNKKPNVLIRNVTPNGLDSIHSISPAWALTFVPYAKVTPTLTSQKKIEKTTEISLTASNVIELEDATIVINDCAQISINESKNSLNGQMSAMLYATDVNYLETIMPGDFVFANIVNNENTIEEIFRRAKNKQPLNAQGLGFKGVFRVNSVRRVLSADPATGTKRIMFQITAFSFSEFNSVVYFNPFLITQEESKLPQFLARLNDSYAQYVDKNKAGAVPNQNLIDWLSSVLIGPNNFLKEKKIQDTPNSKFKIPREILKYLNLTTSGDSVPSAKDIYTYLLGIQTYQDKYTPNLKPCTGWAVFQPEYWNQVTIWSILKRYENSPINELFTSFREDAQGFVKPHIIYRQMPFSSDKFANKKVLSVTKFTSLPRWKIDSNLLRDINIGREDSHRINYVQVQSIAPTATQQANNTYIADQIAEGNYSYDAGDISRSGLRPAILVNQFDTLATDKEAKYSPKWSQLLADFMVGGHLKLNGTITVVGIEDAIAVGDNLELDGVLFHIEAISHQASINYGGGKSFSTMISMSHGVKADQKEKTFAKVKEKRNIDRDILINKDLPGRTYEYTYGQGEIRSSTKNKDKK